MSGSRLTRRVIELLTDVSQTGPAAPEYDGLRVFQHPERIKLFLTGRGRDVMPVTIDLWPSLTCNARCPLCPYRLSGARDEVDRNESLVLLNTALADRILAGAAQNGVQSVIFTGGGDPLLHPNIVDVVRCARKYGLRWGLFTNGLLLDRSVALALLAEKPAFLRVSLDAGTAEEHSRIYGWPESMFPEVIKNVSIAAKEARKLGISSFGLSFTLSPIVPDRELRHIANLVVRLVEKAGSGLGLVAFRPRLLHYHGAVPLYPQPRRELYPELAGRIQELIIEPVRHAASIAPKLDIKEGLFVLASKQVPPTRSLSSAWMTTIDQGGVGYITGELAGASSFGQDWGRIVLSSDFRDLWFGEKRQSLFEALITGNISLPVVHRTSPIDEFLKRMDVLIGGAVDNHLACEIIRSAECSPWYRSGKAEFV